MSYTKQEWLDHIADPETEEIIQQGSPVTANRMNHIEDGIYNAMATGEDARTLAAGLAVKVAVIMGAQFGGVSGNIIIEDMTDTSKMRVERGVYDPEQHKVYTRAGDGSEVALLGYGAAIE